MTADSVYSAGLGLGMVLVAAAVMRLALRARRPAGGRLGDRAGPMAAVGLGLCAVSGLVHLLAGHPPATPEGLGAWAFLRAHPALSATAVGGLAALLWSRRR